MPPPNAWVPVVVATRLSATIEWSIRPLRMKTPPP